MSCEKLIRTVLILLGVMWLSTLQSFAQDTWTQKTSVGTFGRTNAVGFSIGNKGYIGTGTNESGVAQKDFWEFDPVTNSWTQKADLPGQARFYATGFGIGDKGYLGSGLANGGFPDLRDFYEYNPATNSWTPIMDFPRNAYSLLSFVIGSKAYVGTGNYNAQDFWEYDPTINNWIRKADLPGLGRADGIVFTIGDKGYIGSGQHWGGCSDCNIFGLSDFWQYTPATDSWIKKADLPAQYIGSGFGIDSRGYITRSPDKVWQYDLPTDTWVSKNNSTAVDRSRGVSFIIAEKGYIGLGFQTLTGYLNDFWEYTPSPAVTIGSVNPSSGSTSSPVTITGTNFSTTPANNLVTFNGTSAVVTASTATSITTTVPVGATSGPITVTVSGSTATSATNFILTDDQNFITNWNLNAGGSGPTEISFGTATSGTVNYTWQEIFGTATGSGSWSGSTLTITGLPAGSFIRLQIEPTNFQRIVMAGSTDAFLRLIKVEQWGSTAWTSMEQAFSDCFSLFEITATDVPNLSGVTTMRAMFNGCANLNSPSNINSWNTGTVTNMSYLFGGARFFNQNIGGWNTAAVTDMAGMFDGANTFNQNIGSWNVAAVTTMAGMFQSATVFNQDIGSWNTGAVTTMEVMFAFAKAFNQNIGSWNTAAVTKMGAMFYSALVFNNGGSGAINNWNTSAVTDMQSMFSQASAFNQDIGAWNTAVVTDMTGMFQFAAVFNQNIGAWNTAAVTNMGAMFYATSVFNNGGSASINNWNTSGVTSMPSMFAFATGFNQTIGAWNTGAVTSMFGMFNSATAFNKDISLWNTGVVTSMNNMFRGASAFNQNIGAWTLNSGVTLSNMFDTSGMDCNNYSATINGWSANPLTPNGRALGATGRQYGTNAAAARTNLTTTKGWTIVGDTPSGGVCGSVSPPTITSFTPLSGPIGTSVTITGTNFDATPANNIVNFNGTPAVVTTSTSTSINATVSAGTTTGTITVTVGGNTATSATNFTVAPFNISYTAPFSVMVGSTPREVVVGDVDGDGHKDLITSNFGSGSVSFLKGIGNGCFESAQNFNTGPNSHGLALADLNQDSKLDLVVTKGATNTSSLSVLLGNGTPFGPKADYMTSLSPKTPNHVTTGDMNKDGWPDIIVANTNPSSGFSILSNNGNGTFATGVDFFISDAHFIAAEDINGDTYPDVATVSFFTGTASIYLNNGSGGFPTETFYASATGSHYVSLKDLNGDSRPEMIVANAIANSMSVFLNNGSGSFLAPVIYPTGNYPTTISVADMDNNGKLDIVVGNGQGGSITVFPGDGAGGFGASKSFTVGGQPYSVATGDFDEDGNLDIVAVDLSSNKITLLRTQSNTCIPTIASFNPVSGPVGTPVTITGTNFSPTPTNNIVKFNGTTAIITISTATSITTTVPASATTGTITVTVGGNTATSSSVFTVTVPTITITTQPSDAVVCEGVNATFSVIATGTTNMNYQWQFSIDGIVPFADIINGAGYSNATTPTLSINTTGNFGAGRYRCRINGDFVSEVISDDEGLFINPLPASPGTTGNSVCGNGNVTLNASGGTNGQYRWYTASTGGTPITGEVNDTYTTPTISTTTSYYVSIDDGTCESTRTSVDAQIITPPAAPTVTGASDFPPAVLTLTASGGTNGQYRWYTTATGGTALVGEVNSSYTTPSLSTSTTYYVSIDNGQCESSRTPVVAGIKVNSAPVILTTTTEVPVEGTVTVSLTPLISDPEDNLDFSTLSIVSQPISGARATIEPVNNLVLDYSGISFSGTDQLIIGICDQLAACSQKELTIEVVGEITVYNAISPNGDGKNPTIYIKNIEILKDTKENKVTIFNRWGDVVFEAENYDNVNLVFNGLNKSGNELPSGTYYYRIEFTSGKEMKTGFLALKK